MRFRFSRLTLEPVQGFILNSRWTVSAMVRSRRASSGLPLASVLIRSATTKNSGFSQNLCALMADIACIPAMRCSASKRSAPLSRQASASQNWQEYSGSETRAERRAGESQAWQRTRSLRSTDRLRSYRNCATGFPPRSRIGTSVSNRRHLASEQACSNHSPPTTH
jgi:hypothetical protein